MKTCYIPVQHHFHLPLGCCCRQGDHIPHSYSDGEPDQPEEVLQHHPHHADLCWDLYGCVWQNIQAGYWGDEGGEGEADIVQV